MEWVRMMQGYGGYGTDLVGQTMTQDPANGQLVINGGEYADGSFNLETFKWGYNIARPQSATQFNHPLDDRLTESVNPTTTDLTLEQNDFDIAGVGIPLDITQDFSPQ